MPLPLSTAVRNGLNAREIGHAWLLEIFTEEGVLRGWDKPEPCTFEGNTFEALSDLWGIEGQISAGSDLVPEPLTIWFDGAHQLDDASFVGRLLDRTWHQREVRLRQLLLYAWDEFVTPFGVALDWRGMADTINATEGDSGPSNIILTCESGTFRARARNPRTVTDIDQRKIDANDGSLQNLAVKIHQDVPFGTSWSSIPGQRGGSSGGSLNDNRTRFGDSP